MLSYVNAKAIKLIDLFVSFAPLKMTLYKAPGTPLVFKYRAARSPASDRLRTGLEEHHLTFGATLNKWLAEKLGHLKCRVRICSETT